MKPLETTAIQKPAVRSQRPIAVYATRALIWLLLGAGVWVCVIWGLRIRHWAFEIADPIHFIDDMRRGTFWGLNASGPEGYLNQYDKMDPEIPEWQDYRWKPWLDYCPLRLLVMRQWGAWQRAHHPPDPHVPLMDAWQHPYWFNAPVLRFNAVLEGFAAICAFFLTRLWVIRGSGQETRGHFQGVWQGAVAALLIWFNPDIIINAHAWPQWDTWAIPWYLCACLLASLNWWFLAGVAIAIGANLKGQLMPITPIFIIWPLVQGRVGAALRWVCGAVFCFAVIAAGWLITYLPADALAAARKIQANLIVTDYPPNLFAIPRLFDVPAALWIFGMALAVVIVPWLFRSLAPAQSEPAISKLRAAWRSNWVRRTAAMAGILALVFWPWMLQRNRSGWYVGLLAGLAVAALSIFLPRRSKGFVLAGVVGGGLLSCMSLFHGSTAWWDCGFHYGSVHWPFMYTGPTSNLPAIAQIRYGWDRAVDQVAFTLPAIERHWPSYIASRGWWPAHDADITSKFFFNAIYGVMLLLSGIAIGLQTRRNDRRALIAFVTPWIMFFVFPVQIQERYLIYAVGAAACCIGNSVGTALLALLLTLFSMAMELKCLVDAGWSDLDKFGANLSTQFPSLFTPQCGYSLKQFLSGTHPDMGWAIFLVGMLFLYLSLTPSPRSKKT